MNSILGFAQLLEMSELNVRDQKAVSRILDSGGHLLNLINEVLDISRIEAGKVSISLEPVEIKAIIEEVNESLTPFANLKGIAIHNLAANLPNCFVKADTQRLKQILINLINNAIKYNKKNGDVWVVYEPINQKGFVKITIEDNGIGIDEVDLSRIFKPFERAAFENAQTEGTGLGLSVVKQLMGLMGGTFGVESSKGSGSKFWIELPISQSDLDRLNTNGDLNHPHIEMANFNGNVLYIEDNNSNIELIEQVLNAKRPNINLITSTLGSETFDLAKKHSPKLILLDLNLPDMHGSKVLAELTLDPLTRNIPVVVLSADATPSQVMDLMDLGAKNYLTKPININDFLREIDLYIQH
jgi:CheY-like chemotaxis protein